MEWGWVARKEWTLVGLRGRGPGPALAPGPWPSPEDAAAPMILSAVPRHRDPCPAPRAESGEGARPWRGNGSRQTELTQYYRRLVVDCGIEAAESFLGPRCGVEK